MRKNINRIKQIIRQLLLRIIRQFPVSSEVLGPPKGYYIK